MHEPAPGRNAAWPLQKYPRVTIGPPTVTGAAPGPAPRHPSDASRRPLGTSPALPPRPSGAGSRRAAPSRRRASPQGPHHRPTTARTGHPEAHQGRTRGPSGARRGCVPQAAGPGAAPVREVWDGGSGAAGVAAGWRPGRGAGGRTGSGDGFAHPHPSVFSQLLGPCPSAPEWPENPLATWEIRAAEGSRTLRGWAMSARGTFLRAPEGETLRDRMLRAKLPCRHSAGCGTCHSGAAGPSRFDHDYRRTGSRAKPRGNVQERQDLGDANTEGGLAS